MVKKGKKTMKEKKKWGGIKKQKVHQAIKNTPAIYIEIIDTLSQKAVAYYPFFSCAFYRSLIYIYIYIYIYTSSQCARLLAVQRAALNEETVEPGTVLCENIVQTNLLVGRLIKFLRARVNRYGHTLLHEVAARPSVRL